MTITTRPSQDGARLSGKRWVRHKWHMGDTQERFIVILYTSQGQRQGLQYLRQLGPRMRLYPAHFP